jgi:hypothetical protein
MNISNFLSNKNEKDIPNIRKYLYKNYIKTVIENTNNVDENRMILIGNRFKSDFNNPISFECNGAIVSYNRKENKWKTLVVPTELFNSQKICKEELNNHIKNMDYTLYKVYDGTIVNIYYFNEGWRISTNKAYDATNLIFTENKTYNDILEELFTYYKDFNINRLDINKCYTICFKYEKFHTFIESNLKNKNKLILIQSVDMLEFNNNNKLVINYNEDIGIPISQKYILFGDYNLKNINNILYNEIYRYKKNIKSNLYEPNYGIILRSHNFNKTKSYSNILLESNLMMKIRNLIYNYNFAKNLNYFDKLGNNTIIDKKYYNMQDLINLNRFLIGKDINLYLLLFPQFKSKIEYYNTFLKNLTRYIIKHYYVFQKYINEFANVIKNITNIEIIQNYNEFTVDINKLNKLSLYICIELKNKKIDLNVNENYDILYDFLHNNKYIDYYYSCIHK